VKRRVLIIVQNLPVPFDRRVWLECRVLALAGYVEFTGKVPDELVTRILSTADIGLSPDPLNPLNDASTMNKSMEYTAFELPMLAFDLHETRVSVDEAGVYVKPDDVQGYAEAIVALMDDEPTRMELGKLGAYPRRAGAGLVPSGARIPGRLRSPDRRHRPARGAGG
jgi:glycosyltransferase involved in cell wall biosynthesis